MKNKGEQNLMKNKDEYLLFIHIIYVKEQFSPLQSHTDKSLISQVIFLSSRNTVWILTQF